MIKNVIKNEKGNDRQMHEKDNIIENAFEHLTESQRKLIKKEFDYLYCIECLKDDTLKNDKEKLTAYELYLHACHVKIAAMVDWLEKRNKLIEIGVLPKSD